MNIESLIQKKVADTALDIASVGDIALRMSVEIAAEHSKGFGADSVATLGLAGAVIEGIIGKLSTGGLPAKTRYGKSVELPPVPLELIGQMMRDPESYAAMKSHAVSIMSRLKDEQLHLKRMEQEERNGITRGRADHVPAPLSYDPETGTDGKYPAKRRPK
jgi:hypothetical protein